MEREIFALAAASLIQGASAVAITAMIRSVLPETWLLKRPWGCDLCMSTWTCIMVALVLFFTTGEYAWTFLLVPSITVSLFLLARISPPPMNGPS